MTSSAGTFPLSSIPLDAEPDRTWCTCGTCGRTFPDIYPAGRCPFEYDHDETETDTMTDTTTPEPQTPEGAAVLRAFECVGAILGGSLEWDGADALEAIAAVYDRACRTLGLPTVSDQDEAAHRFWSAVGDRYGIEHDDLGVVYGDGEQIDVHDRVIVECAGHPADGEEGIVIAFTPEGAARLLLDGEGSRFAVVPMIGLVRA